MRLRRGARRPASNPDATAARHLAAWEIASVCVSMLLALWVIAPLGGGRSWLRAVPVGAALGLIFLSHYAHNETARGIGWRADNFFAAVKILWLPTLIAIAAGLFIGWRFNSLRFDRSNLTMWSVWLPFWALLQQYILQGFINRRAQIACGAGWRSILLVGAIFALFHLPNPFLGAATFLCGVFWAYVYQRAPNLFALALAHAASSFIAACALPNVWTNSLRVGIKYLG